jgi:hypothetical protein
VGLRRLVGSKRLPLRHNEGDIEAAIDLLNSHMTEELITSGGLLTVLGAKLAYDVCGPTAQYLGGEMSSYAKQGVLNLKKVFENADHFIKSRPAVNGQVPPRVLKHILDEGRFCEDEIQASYLGGILASSRGMISRDDRAMTYASIIESLSTYQIRTHFLIYASILKQNLMPFASCKRWLLQHNVTIVFPEHEYTKSMEFSENEDANIIGEHVFLGLERHRLCKHGYPVVRPRGSDKPFDPFRFVHTTTHGIDLFLWAFGRGDMGMEFYSPDLNVGLCEGFNLNIGRIELGECRFG